MKSPRDLVAVLVLLALITAYASNEPERPRLRRRLVVGLVVIVAAAVSLCFLM